ncbi:MAG TPA: hypothetical protein VK163_05035 [Opitutaceae bacterium]|nr:hypothetical protein [Opitutaceae bacterium]
MKPSVSDWLAGNRGGPIWLLVLGAALLAAGWLLPVQVKSLSPLLLREAGADTPTLVAFGEELRAADKLGPANLVSDAAKKLALPGAAGLETQLVDDAQRQLELVPWGGIDPYLEQVFAGRARPRAVEPKSVPAIQEFLPAKAREAVRTFLANSRSGTVKALLATAEIDHTKRFVPAKRAGGQPLDATILMTALLNQGNWLSDSLSREVRGRAESAVQRGELEPIEDFYYDLLTLSRRLNWIQLGEWLRACPDVKTVGEFSQLLRAAPDAASVLYAASLQSRAPDGVTRYALTFGKGGLAGLETALRAGEGAVRQLVRRQVPVNPDSPLAWDYFASLSLRYPTVMTIVKYLCFFAGVWFVFRALDRALVGPVLSAANRTLMHAKSGVMALVFSGVLFVLSEPFLLRGAPPADLALKVSIPALSMVGQLQASPSTAANVDTSTIITIVFFGALQALVYWICLLKMREIERQNVPSLLKLRLMENEENLFDSGLYVGIAGTATALVLQVLGIIQPNLLAAYSSNLFGITCVAMVKIRHVRPYKKKLIVESQGVVPAKPAA